MGKPRTWRLITASKKKNLLLTSAHSHIHMCKIWLLILPAPYFFFLRCWVQAQGPAYARQALSPRAMSPVPPFFQRLTVAQQTSSYSSLKISRSITSSMNSSTLWGKASYQYLQGSLTTSKAIEILPTWYTSQRYPGHPQIPEAVVTSQLY